MGIAYKKVIELLPHLSDAEVLQLRERLKALSTFTASVPKVVEKKKEVVSVTSSFSDEFLDTIVSVLSSKGVQWTNPTRLKAMTPYNTFVEKVEAMKPWFIKVAPSRVTRKAFMSMAVTLLYSDLTVNGIPTGWDKERHFLKRVKRVVSALELLIFIDRIPAVIAKSFPDYSPNLMLELIIKEKKNVRPKSDYERFPES